MLIYHPLMDINHCIFRFLLIQEKSNHQSFHWELFRLIDFYLLFPSQMKEIAPLPRLWQDYRKIIADIPDEFEIIHNPKRLFFELQNIQNGTLMHLIAKDLIDADAFNHSKQIKRSQVNLPLKLQAKIDESHLCKEPWFDFAVNQLPLLDIFGKNGIKDRSGLLEFKYDAKE